MADRGRPGDYKEEYKEQGRKLCMLGYTDKDLADFWGVCEATINNWKIAHPDFLESINKGKVLADAEVSQSLFWRAKGYYHDDVHISNFQGEVTKTDIVKYYPPDSKAIEFWLKNRQPKLWRDRQDISVKGEIKMPVINIVTKKPE